MKPPNQSRITATSIFNTLLQRPQDSPIEIDRIHQIPSRPGGDPQAPRDVLCRIHFYTLKEDITKKAWEQKEISWRTNKIKILSDLSRKTLRMRALLRPLLEKLQALGLTYKWGFPFHLVIKKGPQAFILQTPKDLPALFDFLQPMSADRTPQLAVAGLTARPPTQRSAPRAPLRCESTSPLTMCTASTQQLRNFTATLITTSPFSNTKCTNDTAAVVELP